MKSIIKTLTAALAFSGLTLFANSAPAQAKTVQPAKVVAIFNLTHTSQVKVTKGYMYSNTQLTKRTHHLTHYRQTIFYTHKTVLLKQGHHKISTYRYLKSKNGQLKGYVYTGFVKSCATTNKTQPKQPTPSNPTPAPQTPVTQPAQPDYTFSLADYRNDFLADLNQERTQRGLNPVTEAPAVDQIAQTRAGQIMTNFGHYDSNHQLIAATMFKQAGISYKTIGECIDQPTWLKNPASTQDGDTHNAKQVADKNISNYIYHDEASNWGHKRNLLNPDFTTVGIGAILNSDKTQVFTAIDLYD